MSRFRLPPSGPVIDIATSSDDVENLSRASGASLTEALETTVTPIATDYDDEFLGGSEVNTPAADNLAIFGELRWTMRRANSNVSITKTGSGTNNSIGNVLINNFVGGTNTGLILGSGFRPSQVTRLFFRALPAATGIQRLGLGVGPQLNNMGNDAIYFEARKAPSAVWTVNTRVSGVLTNTVVTAASCLVFSDLLIERSSAGVWSFAIGGAAVASFSDPAMIPTVDLAPAVQTAGGNSSLVIDRFEMTLLRSTTP